MSRKFNVRVGDVVYHRALDLGKGKVRYTHRNEVVVDFGKASLLRYPKTDLCKSPSHFSGEPCGACGYVKQSGRLNQVPRSQDISPNKAQIL